MSREAFKDLIRIRDEFDAVVESLELGADQDFMKGYREAKRQIRDGELVKWDDV